MLNYFKPVPTAGTKRSLTTSEEAPDAKAARTDEAGDAAESRLRDACAPGGLHALVAPSSGGGGAAAPPDALTTLAGLGVQVHPSWAPLLAQEARKPYFTNILKFVRQQREKGAVYPPPEHVFSALLLTPLPSVKVVVLGQDPYHGPGQAHGLAFSVVRGVPPPPSLVNILKEVDADVGPTGTLRRPGAPHGNLEFWARQGVLLLNTVLTVERGAPQAHAGKGWEELTSAVIRAVGERNAGVVFMLWGAPAQKKGVLVSKGKHLVLEAPHPSPLSAHRGFLGCKHFSKANAYLVSKGKGSVDWSLDAPPGWGSGPAPS